jgi:hypothetical protein
MTAKKTVKKRAAKKAVKKTAAKKTARRKPPNAGKGRPKGSKNKVSANVKEGIMQAYEELGGVNFLVKLAVDDPKTFCSLLGRIIPHEVNGDLRHGGSITFEMVYQPPVGCNDSLTIDSNE